MEKIFIAFKMTAFALLAEVLFYFSLTFSIRKYNWISPDSPIALHTQVLLIFIFILLIRFFLDRNIKDVKTSLIFYSLSIVVSFILMSHVFFLFGVLVSIACVICYFFNYRFFK